MPPQSTRDRLSPRRRAGAEDVAIGGRIRALRVSRKLTQEELAQRLGISSQQLQKYESGDNRVSAARVVDISRQLQVGVADLLTDCREVSGGGSDAPTTAELIDLLQTFSGIADPEARAKVLDMARYFFQMGALTRIDGKQHPGAGIG